jgi:hypothetical protein
MVAYVVSEVEALDDAQLARYRSWPPRPSLATAGDIWCVGLNLRSLKVSLRVGGAS